MTRASPALRRGKLEIGFGFAKANSGLQDFAGRPPLLPENRNEPHALQDDDRRDDPVRDERHAALHRTGSIAKRPVRGVHGRTVGCIHDLTHTKEIKKKKSSGTIRILG